MNKFILAFGILLAFQVQAEDIEEVIVYAQEVEVTQTDALNSTTLISEVLPEHTWVAGGHGGNVLMRERGAQGVHTAVYRNGVPANNPGSGWYDFAHDITSGENVKVVSGANGVMYGSGSIAGTVLIQDTIERSVTGRLGTDNGYVSVAPTDWIQLTKYSTEQYARNDNDEKDSYDNSSAKIIKDFGDFKLTAHHVNYEYDYDNCYTSDFTQSNSCVQDGEKTTVRPVDSCGDVSQKGAIVALPSTNSNLAIYNPSHQSSPIDIEITSGHSKHSSSLGSGLESLFQVVIAGIRSPLAD